MHHDRRVGHFGHIDDALHAQDAGAVGRTQQFQEHIERAGGDRLFRGEDKRHDMIIVPVDVMMMVAV
jgi:hypothetical protein